MQIKSTLRKSSELGQPPFSDTPEVFDTVKMGLAVCKFVVAMLNPAILFTTQANQPVIVFPAIGVDCALKIRPAPRITACSRALEQFRTILMYTFQFRQSNPQTMVFPLAPKQLSSISIPPETEDSISQSLAILSRIRNRYLLTVSRFKPVN